MLYLFRSQRFGELEMTITVSVILLTVPVSTMCPFMWRLNDVRGWAGHIAAGMSFGSTTRFNEVTYMMPLPACLIRISERQAEMVFPTLLFLSVPSRGLFHLTFFYDE